jgi:hypothetical protein
MIFSITNILTICGLTFIIKDSYLLSSVRTRLINLHPIFLRLFECSFCIGFYSCIFLLLINNQYLNYILSCSFMCYIIFKICERLDI